MAGKDRAMRSSLSILIAIIAAMFSTRTMAARFALGLGYNPGCLISEPVHFFGTLCGGSLPFLSASFDSLPAFIEIERMNLILRDQRDSYRTHQYQGYSLAFGPELKIPGSAITLQAGVGPSKLTYQRTHQDEETIERQTLSYILRVAFLMAIPSNSEVSYFLTARFTLIPLLSRDENDSRADVAFTFGGGVRL